MQIRPGWQIRFKKRVRNSDRSALGGFAGTWHPPLSHSRKREISDPPRSANTCVLVFCNGLR